MDASELRQVILSAFAPVSKPSHEQIAPHRCLECDELAADFAPFQATDVPDDVFRKHVWDMPLLSAEAKQYYLPAWLLRCLDFEDVWLPDEASTVLYALDGDHRWDPDPPYTKAQWTALGLWLEHVARFADSIDVENLEKARKRVGNEL